MFILEAFDDFPFFLWQHFGDHFIDPCLSGNRMCAQRMISGHHDWRDPHILQLCDRLCRIALELVSDDEEAAELLIDP